ncbi:MAG: LamG domain-containing protein [Lentisphaeria bacterium]|nr:LamG domain-containing protein [Lentisphaeria bacterium]
MKCALLILPLLTVAALRAQQLPLPPQPDGATVIAHWDLDGKAPAQDDGPSALKGAFQTNATVEEYAPGKAALASCTGDTAPNVAGGLRVNSSPELIPQMPFAFETWFAFDGVANTMQRKLFFLVDKKIYMYETDKPEGNAGYCLYWERRGTDSYALHLWLGFGENSREFVTQPQLLPADTWHQVAFTYNGDGQTTMYLDGQRIHYDYQPDRGPLAQNSTALTLGDRSCGNYNPLAGKLTEATLYQGIPERYAIRAILEAAPGKSVFYRFDKFPQARLRFDNASGTTMTNLRLFQDGKEIADLESLEKGAFQLWEFDVDATGKPGVYEIPFRATYELDGIQHDIECTYRYDVMPRDIPYMPVVSWNTARDYDALLEMGFTHELELVGCYDANWNTGAPVAREENTRFPLEAKFLNERARAGLHTTLWLQPANWAGQKLTAPQYFRLDKTGNPITKGLNIDATNPRVQNFVRNTGITVARQFSEWLSADSALIHSEVRDNSAISYREEAIKAAEAAIGASLPVPLQGKNGTDYRLIPDFPENRVVDDDNIYLKFYSWFWKEGDGWNKLHSLVNEGLKSKGRDDIWTFFDPAVRSPSLWGNGGDVDVVSQWTYSYPDPIKIGHATDELFAMAEGKPGQKVMKMTQIIWYRYRTAPVEKMPQDPARRTEWERREPEAKFISIAPDHLGIALWSMLARPVRGIMYHGWGSLTEARFPSVYRYTNPDTKIRLAQLTRRVVQPFGPMLLEVGDRKANIAFLESFASQVFTLCGSWGWSDSWEADTHLVLQWAGYQPRVVFDETIRKNGLDQYDVLVMPNCAVLTKKVVEEIHRFQKRGGIVVADETLCPAILPDYVMPTYVRTKGNDVDKAHLQAMGAELRKALDPYLDTPFRTSNPDLVGRMRQCGTSDYLFVINDKRTYGNYIGQYRLCMEDGMPNEGTVDIFRKGYVYDLLEHRLADTASTEKGQSFPVRLGPGEGKLFLVTDIPVQKLSVSAPESARLGQEFSFQIDITDEQGNHPDAVLPVKVTVTSPESASNERFPTIEGSGYYAAKDGKLTVTIAPASNDAPGTWKIQVTELAAGHAAETTLQVK